RGARSRRRRRGADPRRSLGDDPGASPAGQGGRRRAAGGRARGPAVTRKVEDVPETSRAQVELDRVAGIVRSLVASLADELVEIRRDLHANPELARAEHRTTAVVAERLELAGLRPRLLPGTGLVCDIGPSSAISGHPRIALRADLDALALEDECGLPWASRSR